MTKDTIKIKQALEAANKLKQYRSCDFVPSTFHGDMDIIIAALSAEQQEEAQPKLPAHMRRSIERAMEDAKHGMQLNDGKERVTLPGGTLAYLLRLVDAAPSDAQPQEQPKPVAWANYADNGNVRIWFSNEARAMEWAHENSAVLYPLYAAPVTVQPASKPGVVSSIDTSEFRALTFDYARAVMHGSVPETSAAWEKLVSHIDKHCALTRCATSSKEASKTDCMNFPLCGCKTPCDVPEDVSDEAQGAAVAAIEFAMRDDDGCGLNFLRCWNEGDFDAIRREWPEAPEEVYIGADPLHPKTHAAQQEIERLKHDLREYMLTASSEAQLATELKVELDALKAQPCRDTVIEECAKVCDEKFAARVESGHPREASTARSLAEAIRALRTQPASVPAQAVTLTDEDIADIACHLGMYDIQDGGRMDRSTILDFARDIERRLLSGSAKTGDDNE